MTISLKKTFLTLFLGALILGPSLHAQTSNQDCIEVYRNGYLDLRDAVLDYNEELIHPGEFAALITGISTEIRARRAACFFTESPDVEECVDKYKTIYKGLRDRIRVRSVLSGNQDKVTFTDDSANAEVSIEEDPNVVRRFFRAIRNQGADTIKQSKLAITDAQCL